jgi:H+/Cl- antiporter ClcA
MNASNSKSSVYDMGTYTLNFSNPGIKQKKTLYSFVWEHLESPILLICIGIVSALVSYILSFASNFSEYNKDILTQSDGYVVWTLYTISNISFAMMSLYTTFYLCPEAVGGGIADMKVILSGSINPDKLSLRLIAAKFFGLGFALASGLSVGKEGPLVHITSAVAEQLMLLESFNTIHQNTTKRLEILACACASGVSSTFGAAYGGVLYSIEVTCTTYMARNIPRAYLSSIVGMLVFLALGKHLYICCNTIQLAFISSFIILTFIVMCMPGATSHITLYTKLGPKVHDHELNGSHSMVKMDEMVVMVLLGAVCGLVGVVFVKLVRVSKASPCHKVHIL